MPQYAILRFEKHKGGSCRALEAHHERQKEKYASNPNIDIEKSKYNFHIIQPTKYYRLEVDERIKAAGCRTRKDSTMFVDTLITASHDFFKGKKQSEMKEFFRIAVDFIADKIGKDNIFSAVVHMDEKTPHLHLCFTPITEDGRLFAKDILGNRVQLSKWQDEFHAHMAKKYPDLARGESAFDTGRKHIPTWLFKQSVNLSRQAALIDNELAGINPLNASKKRDNVLKMLQKWFPKMEKFEGQLRKYQKSIDLLEKENAELAQKAKAGDANKIKTQLEIGKLQSEVMELRRFIDSIPNDLRKEIQIMQKQQGRDWRIDK